MPRPLFFVECWRHRFPLSESNLLYIRIVDRIAFYVLVSFRHVKSVQIIVHVNFGMYGMASRLILQHTTL